VKSIKFICAQETPNGTGVMRGYDSRFHPKGNCTVEEGILAIYRLYRSLERGASQDTSWIDKRGWMLTEVKISAAGDCTLGRDHNSAYANSLDQVYDNSGGDAGLFFRRVAPFFSDDVTIVNFEGTLTDANQPAAKTFRFKGRKAYTHILTEGSVDVVNIANNHSHDYLDRGYSDTYNTLTAAGIAVCGNSYTCIREVNGIKVGFYGLAPMGSGLTQTYKDTIRARINTLKNQGAQYIVGSFHWGIERAYTANANQKQIAHYAVDCGTNLVIGHHPHVLQNTEIYGGAQIIYSLGNFCFGGNRNPSDKDTAVFRENLVMDLETGKVMSRTRIFYPYRLSSVTYRNDYQPVPVSGAEADRVKKKLWI
jgi:poly-gamma-glutamate synthesis protein (capsule biosynthesis protein)